MKLEDYFKNSQVVVWPGNFAVVKAKKSLAGAFAVVRDKEEITVIVEQTKIKDKKAVIEIEKDWKLISFDLVLPFNLVGFLAKISQVLAKKGVSIFVISSYSTDHLLVKKKDLLETISQLKKLGLKIKEPV